MNRQIAETASAGRSGLDEPGVPAVRATVCAGSAETRYLRAGRGPNVLLLPGADAEIRQRLLASLSTRFRVVVPETEAQLGVLDGNQAEAGAAWLRDFLDGLGIQRVSLVAAGETEAAALRFTQGEPERVERLVLLGPAGGGLPHRGPEPLADAPTPIPILRDACTGTTAYEPPPNADCVEQRVIRFLSGEADAAVAAAAPAVL